MTSSTKPEVYNVKGDQATATGNMYGQFGKIWTCGFQDKQTDGQTNRHADHNTVHHYWGQSNQMVMCIYYI